MPRKRLGGKRRALEAVVGWCWFAQQGQSICTSAYGPERCQKECWGSTYNRKHNGHLPQMTREEIAAALGV